MTSVLLEAATCWLLVALAAGPGSAHCGQPFASLVAPDNRSLYYVQLKPHKFYLPIYRDLQLRNGYQEQRRQLLPVANGLQQELNYYVNPKIKLDKLTEDDLIFESLDQAFKLRIYHTITHDYDLEGDRRRSSEPDKEQPAKCLHDLSYLVMRLAEMEAAHGRHEPANGLTPDLATYLDAVGAPKTGLLLGNFNWLGEWRQCSQRLIIDPYMMGPNKSRVAFRGRFCQLKLVSKNWAPRIEDKVRRMKAAGKLTRAHDEANYRRYFRLQLGLCLPEACSSNSLAAATEPIRRLAMHKLPEPLASYRIEDLFCLPDEGSPLRQPDSSGWLLIGLASLWLKLLATATCAHYYRGEASLARDASVWGRLVRSFSLLTSYRSLVPAARARESAQTRASSRDVRFVDFIKVIVMPAILYGHVGLLTTQYTRFPLDFEPFHLSAFYRMVGSVFFVDYYFCITGFLTAYLMFASDRILSNTWLHWCYGLFHRYWRLAPTYLLLFWFSRSLFHLTGSGPLWDYGTSNLTTRAMCRRESWLVPLTLTSNWLDSSDECNMPTWYISSDFQFYLASPPLLLVLARSSAGGWALVLASMAASALNRAYTFYSDARLDPWSLVRARHDLIARNQLDIPDTYLRPHHRWPAYALGLLAGHYAYQARAGRWRSPLVGGPRARLWRRLVAGAGLALCLAWQLAPELNELLIPDSLEQWGRQLAALMFAADHSGAALGLAMLLVALTLGAWPRLRRRWLEARLWAFLSRINYFVFLYQVELIMWLLSSASEAPDSSLSQVMSTWALTLLLVYPAAALATLLLANPLARLEFEFVGSRLRGERATPPSAEAPRRPEAGEAEAEAEEEETRA